MSLPATKIEELGDQAAAGKAMPPAEGITAPNVVCIAGRGSFDASVSVMIVQLLEKRGIAAQILPLAGLSREAIALLDLEGFDTVVFSYLGLSSAPLRLIRRLRQRAPLAQILVCPWPEGETVPNVLPEIPGADGYCVSFGKLLDSIASNANAQTAGRTEPAELA